MFEDQNIPTIEPDLVDRVKDELVSDPKSAEQLMTKWFDRLTSPLHLLLFGCHLIYPENPESSSGVVLVAEAVDRATSIYSKMSSTNLSKHVYDQVEGIDDLGKVPEDPTQEPFRIVNKKYKCNPSARYLAVQKSERENPYLMKVARDLANSDKIYVGFIVFAYDILSKSIELHSKEPIKQVH